MAHNVSGSRKLLYYLAIALSVVGILLFLSTFVTFFMSFGNFTYFEARSRGEGLRAFAGIVLLVIGNIVMRIGARGAAGSGLMLDPERARRDLEPYSRQAGGMLHDALEEINLYQSRRDELPSPLPVIMIKCPQCGKLNEEDSKFCQECGVKL